MGRYLQEIEFLDKVISMKIRCTSCALENVSDVISKATIPMEDEFDKVFSELSYGGEVDQFLAVAIAAGSLEDNQEYFKEHNRSGTYKHPITKEKVKFISFALPFTEEEMKGVNDKEFSKLFCNALKEKLDNPDVKITKGFDYDKFSLDMKAAIDKYSSD